MDRRENNKRSELTKKQRDPVPKTSSQHIGQIHSPEPRTASSREPRLQTGKVGTGDRDQTYVNFIMDTGASISLISEKVAKELKLRKLRDTETSLSGLGGRNSGTKTYSIYEVPLRRLNEGKLTIQAMGHTEPLTAVLNYTSLPPSDLDFLSQRKHIQMADTYSRTMSFIQRS